MLYTMGNAAMCKVCGSDKGLRTVETQSDQDKNDLPEYFCEEHFPAPPPLMLVRDGKNRCSLYFGLSEEMLGLKKNIYFSLKLLEVDVS